MFFLFSVPLCFHFPESKFKQKNPEKDHLFHFLQFLFEVHNIERKNSGAKIQDAEEAEDDQIYGHLLSLIKLSN